MKRANKNKLYLTIIILIIIISILAGIIINLVQKNKINKSIQTSEKQLTETTKDNAYVSMETHLAEVAKANEVTSSFFDEIFSDLYITVHNPTGYTYAKPYEIKTKEYFQSFLAWGTSTKTIRNYTNCINYDTINTITIDYVVSNDNASSKFQCLDSNNSSLKSVSLSSSTRTTISIDVSTLTGYGKFQIYQSVNGESNQTYDTTLTIYDITLS